MSRPAPKTFAAPWTYGLRPVTQGMRAEHDFLRVGDRCFFLFDYRAGCGGPSVNQLIAALKSPPTAVAADHASARRKRCAVAAAAVALRQCIPRAQAESVTWVPVPPSKARDDPDYDDRLERVLALAFRGYDVDMRSLMSLRHSVAADHAAAQRLSARSLRTLLVADDSALAAAPLRSRIVLFDDVLTSGKHFRCCEQLLRSLCPGVTVDGVFLARRALTVCRHGVAEPRWLEGKEDGIDGSQ
jgi:hypothetical protein